MEHQNTNTNIQAAFDALFNEPAPAYKTPWEKWNMSYDEWHKMYVKALDDAVEHRKNPDPDMNPLYDRECEDSFVDSAVETHSVYFREAMNRLEAIRVPSFMDWHYAEFCRKFLQEHHYIIWFNDPFDSSYENLYVKYVMMLGLEDEFEAAWLEEYDRLYHLNGDMDLEDDLPF